MSSPKVVLFNSQEFGNAAIVKMAEGFTIDMLRERMPGVDLYEFSFEELPMADADFEAAWKVDTAGPRVVVDLPLAKIVTKARLRFERKPLLEALDIAFMKAQESGLPVTEIAAEKQRLRDITLLPDACSTLEQLRALKAAQ